MPVRDLFQLRVIEHVLVQPPPRPFVHVRALFEPIVDLTLVHADGRRLRGGPHQPRQVLLVDVPAGHVVGCCVLFPQVFVVGPRLGVSCTYRCAHDCLCLPGDRALPAGAVARSGPGVDGLAGDFLERHEVHAPAQAFRPGRIRAVHGGLEVVVQRVVAGDVGGVDAAGRAVQHGLHLAVGDMDGPRFVAEQRELERGGSAVVLALLHDVGGDAEVIADLDPGGLLVVHVDAHLGGDAARLQGLLKRQRGRAVLGFVVAAAFVQRVPAPLELGQMSLGDRDCDGFHGVLRGFGGRSAGLTTSVRIGPKPQALRRSYPLSAAAQWMAE